MTTAGIESVVVAGAVGVAAGVVGAFALMRRMSLAGDALSHVALPGIAIALLLRADPFLGALVALVLGALLVWALQWRTQFATETLVGVVFSTALALGALLTTREELIDALFGAGAVFAPAEVVSSVSLAAGVVAFCILERDALIVTFVSEDIARTVGIRVGTLSLLFLTSFAIAVALGLRYLGALLMGSLMIIPAATARRLARSLRDMIVLSTACAVFAMFAGVSAAGALHIATGPITVTIAAALFVASLVVRPRQAG